MDPQEAEERFRLADELYRGERYAESLAVLDELDGAFPVDRHVMFPRARCLAQLGRRDESLALCEDIIERFQYAGAVELRDQLEASSAPVISIPEGLDDILDPVEPDLELPDETPAEEPAEVPAKELFPAFSTKGAIVLAVVGALVVLTGLLFVFWGGTPSPAQDRMATESQGVEGPVEEEDALTPSAEFQGIFGSAFFGIACWAFLALLAAPVGCVYVTLFVGHKLPGEGFGSDLFGIAPVAVGTGVLATFCPYVGWGIALFVLYKVYDLDALDVLVLVVAFVVAGMMNQYAISPLVAPNMGLDPLGIREMVGAG